MNTTSLHASSRQLPDKGHVIIIGGGPGGVACALRLKRRAAELSKAIRVTIVESKQFSGEQHYNQCSGVLTEPLPEVFLDLLQIPFPSHLGRTVICGYVLHTSGEQITLEAPEEDSLSVRRVQFDAYMLEQAESAGIEIVRARAVDVEFHADWVTVYTDNTSVQGDVIVGAFGLDEGSGALFSRVTGYRPPESLSAVVTKYHPGPDGIAAFGPYIHAFLPRHPRIEFGAITPKGNHLTINIAGRSVDTPLMQQFLDTPEVRAALPNIDQAGKYDPKDLRFFKGRFPSHLARRYYGNRYIMVGDAAGLVRAFKGKGVTSAVETGIRAADAILDSGISKDAFHRQYRNANRDITDDLPYGRVMRLVTIGMAQLGLLDPVIRAARSDDNLRRALYDAVSARAPYRDVVLRAFRPTSLAKVLWNLRVRSS